MSIPLERLYNYIHAVCNKIHQRSIIIYRFWPHGEKNILNLNPLSPIQDWYQLHIAKCIWCHDQEPLDYNYYEQIARPKRNDAFAKIREGMPGYSALRNINYFSNIFGKSILIHSEKRSRNLEKYLQPHNKNNSQLLSVYYWSHALIGRDWFRYAEHATFCKIKNKLFLIYNRSWTGTREYRLKFTDLLIEHNIVDKCLTFCNPEENGIHYVNHKFKNSDWRPNYILENYVPLALADSSASADFDIENYNRTEIEIVLETLFDDDRLHLTEKCLRPIACRQPFILAATHGSLQYLRDYGFQTFDCVWSEKYDTIEDPVKRMLAIIELMRDIATWSDTQRIINTKKIAQIVNYNHRHFFSKKFLVAITDELQVNLANAFDYIEGQPNFEKWVQRWHNILKFPQVNKFLDTNADLTMPNRQQYIDLLSYIRNHTKK